MELKTPYRNITSSVRTPRYAVFIDKSDKYWKTYINSIIQSFCQVWGGEYFLIIPTDGKTIDEKFWEILETYSPDKLGKYIPSFMDLELADPERYKVVKASYKEAWKLESDEKFEEIWRGQAKDANINGLEITKELSEELKNRLSPFHFQDHIISENLFHNSPLGFPFTSIEDIVDSAKDRPSQVTIPKHIESEDFRLLATSRAGALSAEYLNKLKEKGITEITLPEASQTFRDRDYILALEKGEYDLSWQRAFNESLQVENNSYPESDFIPDMPFRLSMLHLGKYYRRDTHHEHQENLLVVVGNEMTDFCLFYCLSRMHAGVYWLPEHYLNKANAKCESNKKRGDKEIKKYTKWEDLASGLVSEYYHLIRFGHDAKKLDITSFSLTDRKLETRKRWMANISYHPQEYLQHISVKSLKDVSINCVMRVVEANNHANQQDMIFQNGKSVGRVNTPKPKNFSPVSPSNHRWITTLEIDGYGPPVLPFLGSEIIRLMQMGYETRVAKDGLAYLCPSVAYFGGDIDVNTVRPELQLLTEEEIFQKYFAYSGFNIELSDKGSYLKDTIDRFGSLENVAKFFKETKNREMLGQFLFTKAQSDGDDEIVFLDTEKRSYLSLEAFSRKLASSEEAAYLIDDLIEKDVLRRGLIFQCERCRLTSWYGIEEVGRDFKCKRCDLLQPYTHKSWKWSDEPRWYYRLAETVYQFYRSSSHLTALSLDKLRQESKIAFHYICETEILDPLGKVKKREVDILAISDGNIIIGECKDTSPNTADITNYNTFFSQLTIRPFQFLLATTEDSVSSEVQTALDKMKNTRLFNKNDIYGS